MIKGHRISVVMFFVLCLASSGWAQFGPRGPRVTSPDITSGQVAFRILAPKADTVLLAGSDIPSLGRGMAMTKDPNGVWEVILTALKPGAYRYNFNVDGVSVIDPVNPATSQSNANTWSLMYVPGAEFMDTQNVPHGAVSEVTYYSKSLKRARRMHVYTPPGYEKGQGMYPIFYLLHGAMDCDDSWTSVGRAGFILDNLIAGNKAKPMVVVMPAGHAGSFNFGGSRPTRDAFLDDFQQDIQPYAESHYRVTADRQHRAIAGLSMGGGHTISLSMANLDAFGYIGVFSSGIFSLNRQRPQSSGLSFEEQHKDVLANADLKKGLKLFWFATGKEDFLVETTRATVALFKKYDFEVVYKETEGAHTWVNWREYLNEFAPQLFK